MILLPILLFTSIDWPAAMALVGIAATMGSYWLQDRRDVRDQADLLGRVERLEKDVGQLIRVVNEQSRKMEGT